MCVLVLMLVPLRASAQCHATPSFTSLPDEPPALREPAAAILARAAAIEAMARTSSNWGLATFELAEAYRASGATEEEVRTWARLLEEVSDDGPSMDAALYHLGRALYRMGDAVRARAVFLRLVSRHPTSPYVEATYAAFGEHFAREGDLDAAIQFFEAAARTPGRWAAYVAYRSAWARAARHDHGAAAELDRAVTLATQAGMFVPAALRRALASERAAVVALSACP